MAASLRGHVPLYFGRYFRVLLQKTQKGLYSNRGNHSVSAFRENNLVYTQSHQYGRRFSSVNGEGDSPFELPGGKGSPQDKGAEKRRVLKAKKEARRQLALQRQREKQLKKVEKKSAVYDIQTPPGCKKDVTVPLPDAYSPEYVEAAWYEWWEQEGFFKPETVVNAGEGSQERGQFVICLPPPNVTGTLHLGHALGNSIQDALIRWHRMQGHSVLWVPGTDHAGIATQVVVERQLASEQGLTRHQIGRKAFVDYVWQWKNEKGSVISEQMRQLGSSLDWSREFFTLDPRHSRAVNEAFIRLHNEGLIYRKERLVNWSCALKSTISDIEVANIPLEKKTYLSVPGYERKVAFGELTSFAYPVKDSDDEVVVATTRLETMLGDTAVAVHPEDSRFVHLHGRVLLHPLTGNTVPIITDSAVQMDYGSGAVKITPGHDQKDYVIGQRHALPLHNILDDSGRLTNVPEHFLGMPRFDARVEVLKLLKEKNLYRGTCDNPMVLPQCSRSGDIIEPRLKDQWYVDCSEMADLAVKAVESGQLELIPSQYTTHWYEWLKNPQDWCISRQLWWGHQVPAYRIVGLKSGQTLPSDAPLWVSGHGMTEALTNAATMMGVAEEEIILEQDEDVLDTWFSSAIVPFAAMGWPDKTSDFQQYYPNDLLETASDILFFWVARMVMIGQALTHQLPFKQVLLHSILRDSHGRKMSKSLGNVVDPMDVIKGISLEELQAKLSSNLPESEISKAKEGQKKDFPLGIPECGTDALRFKMCSYNYKNQYVNVDVNHMAANRRFCNKVWQAFRYCSSHWDQNYTPPKQIQLTEAASATDYWILSQLSEMVAKCQKGFDTYALYNVTDAIYSFLWFRFCDVYLEYSKTVFQEGDPSRVAMVTEILHLCVSTGLRALSPFMPYLTEELYQRLPGVDLQMTPSVTLATYPQENDYPWRDVEIDDRMVYVQSVINQVLSIRKDFYITKAKHEMTIVAASDSSAMSLQDFVDTISVLSRSNSVTITKSLPMNTIGCVQEELKDGSTLYLKLAGLLDQRVELERLTLQKDKLVKESQRLHQRQNKLNLPEQTILMENEKLKKVTTDLERLERTIETLRTLT